MFDPIVKSRQKPTSLRLAINAKCCECIGGIIASGWRREIRDCTAPRCPLYPLRPYQGSEDETDDV
jgi:hypothetical protein